MQNPFSSPNNSYSIDLSHLQRLGNTDLHQIPTRDEQYRQIFGRKFVLRPTHIYDPTKFWFTPKPKELEAFQKYLFSFYYRRQNQYRIPRDRIKPKMYCVAATEGGYYRGVVLGMSYTVDKTSIKVHLIDYGNTENVPLVNDSVFYMTESVLKVPKFAMRGTIARMRPYHGCKSWRRDQYFGFVKLCQGRDLVAQVEHFDSVNLVFHLVLKCKESNVLIDRQMIDEKFAKPVIYAEGEAESVDRSYYRFPLHLEVEAGVVPCTIDESEFILA